MSSTGHTTYQELGIPESYHFKDFLYAPSGNVGVAVFCRKQDPQVDRIFWRRSEDEKYSMIPVIEENHSLTSCAVGISSETVYYSVMHWRKPDGHKSFGGYWVSLNSFSLHSRQEQILVSEKDLDAMTGTEGSWISRILHITPDESQIDVVAGVNSKDGMNMQYAVHRIDLKRLEIVHRLSMPGVFI